MPSPVRSRRPANCDAEYVVTPSMLQLSARAFCSTTIDPGRVIMAPAVNQPVELEVPFPRNTDLSLMRSTMPSPLTSSIPQVGLGNGADAACPVVQRATPHESLLISVTGSENHEPVE